MDNGRHTGLDATEPRDFPWGSRMFTITAPDGHEMDFCQPLED